MVNFNTSELKVSITRAKAGCGCTALSKESIEKLEAALICAVRRDRDMLVILAFANHFIPVKDFNQIKKTLSENHKADFLYALSDLIVIRNPKGNVITVKICSGSILFADGEPPQQAVINIMSSPPSKKRAFAAPPPTAAAKKSTMMSPIISSPTPRTSGKCKQCTSDEEDIGELTQECYGLL